LKINFIDIISGLEKLSFEGNSSTRKLAYQLYSAALNISFSRESPTVKYPGVVENAPQIFF